MKHWCSKCQKLMLTHTTIVVSKGKKTVRYNCQDCHSTTMIDEYANYPTPQQPPID